MFLAVCFYASVSRPLDGRKVTGGFRKEWIAHYLTLPCPASRKTSFAHVTSAPIHHLCTWYYSNAHHLVNYRDSRHQVNYRNSCHLVTYKDSCRLVNYKDTLKLCKIDQVKGDADTSIACPNWPGMWQRCPAFHCTQCTPHCGLPTVISIAIPAFIWHLHFWRPVWFKGTTSSQRHISFD